MWCNDRVKVTLTLILEFYKQQATVSTQQYNYHELLEKYPLDINSCKMIKFVLYWWYAHNLQMMCVCVWGGVSYIQELKLLTSVTKCCTINSLVRYMGSTCALCQENKKQKQNIFGKQTKWSTGTMVNPGITMVVQSSKQLAPNPSP